MCLCERGLAKGFQASPSTLPFDCALRDMPLIFSGSGEHFLDTMRNTLCQLL